MTIRTDFILFTLFWFLWVPASADWVKLRCYPKDCQVTLQRKGTSNTVLGSASQALELQPGHELLLERKGWRPLVVVLPDQLAEVYPEAPGILTLETDPNQSGARVLYYLKSHLLISLLLLAVLAVGLLKVRRKPGLDRAEKLGVLEDDILERGAFSMQVLGSYRLLEPVNEGGMAMIYRAVPESTLDSDQPVAVKVLKRVLAEDAAYIKRWKREARITAELRHPNLVKVFGSGEQEGIHFLAMEFLEGKSLTSLIRPGGVPWKEAVSYVLPILDALSVVHKAGIIHRDINPQNIVISPRGVVRVIDFGIARGEDYTRATKTGVVMGTPSYLAPEQLLGQLHPATDQYAVGILLYELVNGSPPFRGDDPVDVMMQHSGRQVPPLRESIADLPQEFETIVLKMLSKKPQQRYADVERAKLALEALLQGSP